MYKLAEDTVLSDHRYVICHFPISNFKKKEPYHVFRRIVSPNNVRVFSEYIENVNWESFRSMNGDFQGKFDYLYQTVLYYYDLAFPVTKIKVNKDRNFYLPQYIKDVHKLLCEMSAVDKQINNTYYHSRFVILKSTYRLLISRYSIDRNNTRILGAENKMKESWRIVNEYRGKKSEPITKIVDSDSRVYNDTQEICECFADFFHMLMSQSH